MNTQEFQKFLTEPKEYLGRTYTNAQLIALQAFQQGHSCDLSKIEPLNQEQEQYYTKMILGEFIESNPKGNYCLTDEMKKCLSLLEKTLRNEYGLSDSQLKKYWAHLMEERAKMEKFYMDKIDTFYHLSPLPPNKLPRNSSGEVSISLKKCTDAYHQMNGMFCYLAPKGAVPLCLRKTEMKMYPYYNPRFVVVCTNGKDFESSCDVCYEYEVERSSAIRPVVIPSGNKPVEYVSTKSLKVVNLDNLKIQTPKTLVEDGLKIYLIDDLKYYTLQTQKVNTLPLKEQEEHFENLVKDNPDKIRLYTPSSGKKQKELPPAAINKLKNSENF